MKRLIWGAVVLAAGTGCSQIHPPQPTEKHPANPQATSADEPDLSNVLAVDEKNLPQVPAEMRRGMMHHGPGQRHGGMMGAGSSEKDPTATSYACPMHPEVMSQEPGECPQCGMQLVSNGASNNE